VRCHPDQPPEGAVLTSRIQWAGSSPRILGLPASPWSLPLAPGSPAFLGGFPAGQAGVRPVAIGRRAVRSPPTSASLDGPGLAAGLWPVSCFAGLVLMQAARSWRRTPLVMGKPADYQLRFFAPAWASARIGHRLSPMPWCPVVVRPRATRQAGGPGRRSSQGAECSCANRLVFRH